MVIPHLFVFPRVTSPSHVAPRWLPRCSPVTATSCRCTTSCCRGSAARPWSITWRRWRRRVWARRSGAPRSARPRMGGATWPSACGCCCWRWHNLVPPRPSCWSGTLATAWMGRFWSWGWLAGVVVACYSQRTRKDLSWEVCEWFLSTYYVGRLWKACNQANGCLWHATGNPGRIGTPSPLARCNILEPSKNCHRVYRGDLRLYARS